ncbi:hypothetical protein BaRGS_00025385 [Batillaria attramentaria]|uniref:Uncharacterized protein n=1 Tax=Batillaria attramentaria TaxID=370345 RepID=A0ABD0K8P0_9CAEN
MPRLKQKEREGEGRGVVGGNREKTSFCLSRKIPGQENSSVRLSVWTTQSLTQFADSPRVAARPRPAEPELSVTRLVPNVSVTFCAFPYAAHLSCRLLPRRPKN